MHPVSITLEAADQTRCMFAMQVCDELPNPVPHGEVPEGFPASPQRCCVHPGTPPGDHGTPQVCSPTSRDACRPPHTGRHAWLEGPLALPSDPEGNPHLPVCPQEETGVDPTTQFGRNVVLHISILLSFTQEGFMLLMVDLPEVVTNEIPT
jgi:hypothetical protein